MLRLPPAAICKLEWNTILIASSQSNLSLRLCVSTDQHRVHTLVWKKFGILLYSLKERVLLKPPLPLLICNKWRLPGS